MNNNHSRPLVSHLLYSIKQNPPQMKKQAFTLQIPVGAEPVKTFSLRINLATHTCPSVKTGSR